VSKRKSGKLPPFVPLYRDTLKAPAWIAMSNGAKMLYVYLKLFYNNKLQNHVFISTREAEDKLGSSRECVRQWFLELQHYGFTEMVDPGGLGVAGVGKSPHWRLTDEWYLGKAPTRDYLNWTGEVFEPRRRKRDRRPIWEVRKVGI
jgi:hypothetical protein